MHCLMGTGNRAQKVVRRGWGRLGSNIKIYSCPYKKLSSVPSTEAEPEGSVFGSKISQDNHPHTPTNIISTR